MEHWNGTSWSIEPTPNPLGTLGSNLTAVSCPSATACTAVGSFTTSTPGGYQAALAERWNGSAWSIQTAPTPAGAIVTQLNGVSCASASACIAVGSADYPTVHGLHQGTVAERWDGTSWSIQPTPNPTGAKGGALIGVSCTSPTACTAVGSFYDSANAEVTLAERWNGTSWTVQTTPKPFNKFSGVSCTSATVCTAVGDGFAERWNGTSWSVESSSLSGNVNGVSCTSPTACTAVGSFYNSANAQVTLAERWSGTSWTVQTTPNPTGAYKPELDGVSCTSPTACTAVGFYYAGSPIASPVALAEVWNGTSWSTQTTPPNTFDYLLTGVSCTSASACTAVGGADGSALAERYS
jgi:hypothetical protein